jgi:hypothetical protein
MVLKCTMARREMLAEVSVELSGLSTLNGLKTEGVFVLLHHGLYCCLLSLYWITIVLVIDLFVWSMLGVSAVRSGHGCR